MRLNKALEDKLLDTRLRDKLISEGKVTKAQVKEYLDAMPDEEDNSIYTHELDGQNTAEIADDSAPVEA